MIHWIDLVAIGLAAGVPINAWLHKGGIFEEWVEWLRVWAEFVPTDTKALPDKNDRIRERVGQLLTCFFCLSHYTPWILILLFYLPSLCFNAPWSVVIKLPIYAMAATRITLIVEHFMRKNDE